MDHSHHMNMGMDMGHDHGDMDMGGGQCNMNVCQSHPSHGLVYNWLILVDGWLI